MLEVFLLCATGFSVDILKLYMETLEKSGALEVWTAVSMKVATVVYLYEILKKVKIG